MGRPDEVAEFLRAEKPPSRIAEELGMNYNSVMDYAYRAVGRGIIERSDIVFSLDSDTRTLIEEIIEDRTSNWKTLDWSDIQQEARRRGRQLNKNDLKVYLDLRGALIEDMYTILCRVEVFLHEVIKMMLQHEYRDGEEQWWVKGVPLDVRQRCVKLREENGRDLPEYGYTNLVDLKVILDKQWKVFSRVFGDKNKSQIVSNLDRMHQIRNDVMHPVKGYMPDLKDYRFMQGFLASLTTSVNRFSEDSNGNGG